MSDRTHVEISKEIQEVEKKLRELGVPVGKLEEILGHADNYQLLNKDLQEARKRQFFNDVWVIQNIRGGQKDTQIAEYLRRFAEHVAQRVCDIVTDRPDLPLDEIVDMIPPMEDTNPYQRD